jgi:hypothetical protein
MKITPEWLKMKADVDKAVAKQIALGRLADAVTPVATQLVTDVRTVATKASAAASDVHARVTQFETSVLSKLQDDVATSIKAVTSGALNLEGKIGALSTALSDAHAKLSRLTEQAHAQLISAALAADTAAQSGIESAQASVEQSVASAGVALDKANSDYAQLLAIETAGMDNALPAGNATGARSQSGHFHYDIAGS